MPSHETPPPGLHGAPESGLTVSVTTVDGERLDLDTAAVVRGGEACVYPARSPEGRQVAVKVALYPEPEGAWLHEEGALLAQLGDDPTTARHVVAVRGRGWWAGRPFLVEDWYDETVEERVRRGPSRDERLELAARICDAVAALHARHPPVLHRDLKPTNLLLDGDRPRLADFGLARPILSDATTTTLTLHTPGYGPPELRRPGPHRPALHQDRYGLAATVLFVLLGRSPRPDALSAELCALADDADAALLDVLAGMLAASPPDRRGTATELAAALRRARAARPDRRQPDTGSGPRPTVRPAEAALDRRATDPPARSARPALVAGVLGAMALGLAAVALHQQGRAPSDETVPEPPLAYRTVRVEAGPHVVRDGALLRRATLDAPLDVGVTEVTQALWEALTGEPLAHRRAFFDGALGATCTRHYMLPLEGPDRPMVCVDFFDVVDLANRLSRAHGLAPAYTVIPRPGRDSPEVRWDRGADGWRLPTNLEWEAFARAGREGSIPSAAHEELCTLGNIGDDELVAHFPTFATQSAPVRCSDGWAGPAPVGSFPPNALGLHDTWGNVHEWVWDEGKPGARRTRGGSYVSSVTDRVFDIPGELPAVTRQTTLGVRLVRTAR